MNPTVIEKSRWILWIYVGGFLLGACAHIRDIIWRGFPPYTDVPLAINVYWTSLIVLDLLVASCLLVQRRLAALLAVAVMASDILVDVYEASKLGHQSILTNFPLQGICVFGVFVFVTAPLIWKHSNNPGQERL